MRFDWEFQKRSSGVGGEEELQEFRSYRMDPRISALPISASS
jgi:hypothetical protein